MPPPPAKLTAATTTAAGTADAATTAAGAAGATAVTAASAATSSTTAVAAPSAPTTAAAIENAKQQELQSKASQDTLVVVSNLPFSAQADDIKAALSGGSSSTSSAVVSVVFALNKRGRSKGIATVQFTTAEVSIACQLHYSAYNNGVLVYIT
jgi:RNA recognition motif. (a.k.a. RRM, RBD, or RNP domain)